MALSYDPGSRKWNVTYEKTDYRTDYPTNLPTNLRTDYPETYVYYVTVQQPRQQAYYESVPRTVYSTIYTSTGPVTTTTTTYDQVLKYRTVYENVQEARYAPDNNNIALNQQNRNANKINKETNESNTKLNAENTATNQSNTAKNKAYDSTRAVANSTRGGDYTAQRQVIRNIQGIDDRTKKTLEDYYKAFYRTEKLQRWDSNLGAKPPYGEFDPGYYKSQNPEVVQAWNQAVANDDLDIIDRYGENGYYLQHYTNVGKAAGRRGNKTEGLGAAQQYVEKTPTDAELQQVRNLQLGTNIESTTQRLLNVPEIAEEWNKARAGDPYWKSKAKEFFLDIDEPDEFAALFRLSDRPEDKEIAFQYNANADYGITELEDAINQAVGEKATVDVKKFAALTQDVLRQTIDEMKKAKAQEQQLSMFSGFGAFKEIVDINKELSNSILGDTGVGGILAFTGGSKAGESLEKSLQRISGINNNVTYNWQQWFDETLKKRYEQDLELGLSTEEAQAKIDIEAQFAREFIDEYLIPRFDESRSMDEFVEYLDVRQSEQNPFQTQDIVNAAKLVADLRAQQYLDELKKTPERYFDSNFYFNPSGDKGRADQYSTQTIEVNADWNNAKKNANNLVDPNNPSLGTWAQQAYRFGVNINDKDAFARMHYQIKGRAQGYDAADDILNASKVSDRIYNSILPALKEEALKSGTVFGQFIKPEEFADEMLKGLDPNDKDTWNEVLDRYGLQDFKGTLEELKEYVIEALRTGTAQEIREQIKYLNEKKERPTQEILGVTYIERPEDYKPEAQIKGETELYKVFQTAGFQGTEDEFYENFFPDLDRSEQIALTKAGKDEPLKTTGLDLKDPYASLATVESFFDFEPEDTDEEVKPRTSYFTIDTDEELPEKTKAGQGFLDEFTSLFKGFG